MTHALAKNVSELIPGFNSRAASYCLAYPGLIVEGEKLVRFCLDNVGRHSTHLSYYGILEQ